MTESPQIAEYMKIRRYVLSLALKNREKSVQIPTTMELSRKFGVSQFPLSASWFPMECCFISMNTMRRICPPF